MHDDSERAMAEAMKRQRAAAGRSRMIPRRDWAPEQWVEDAERLMNEPDGAITSLVNGHALHLIREVKLLRGVVQDVAHELLQGEQTVSVKRALDIWEEAFVRGAAMSTSADGRLASREDPR